MYPESKEGRLLIAKAREYALARHAGQTREDAANTRLEEHLAEAAELVQESGGTAEEIAATWLHDILEDTETTIREIIAEFGGVVGAIVFDITDPPEFRAMHDVQILAEKILQAEHIGKKSPSVRRVKIADQISNVRSIGVKPLLKWSREQTREYLEGARHVAEACRGISPLLDKKFSEAYEEATSTQA